MKKTGKVSTKIVIGAFGAESIHLSKLESAMHNALKISPENEGIIRQFAAKYTCSDDIEVIKQGIAGLNLAIDVWLLGDDRGRQILERLMKESETGFWNMIGNWMIYLPIRRRQLLSAALTNVRHSKNKVVQLN